MTTTSTALDESAQPKLSGKRKSSMAVAATGAVVEWYDFSIYMYAASYLRHAFFGGNEDSRLLALGVAAAGLFFRPVGAIVFGHFGDTIGRKKTLVISVLLMTIAMFAIALTPSMASIGIWSGIALIFFRCLSGFAVGAEYTGIMVYLMEIANNKNRGFTTSWAPACSGVGVFLAVGVTAALTTSLGESSMQDYGWRFLFVVGGLITTSMIPLRSLMEETKSFEQVEQEPDKPRFPVIEVFKHQPRALLVVFLISAIGSVTYFLNITYLPTYFEIAFHETNTHALLYGLLSTVVAILVTPLFGFLSDKYGRRKAFLGILILFLATSVPLYSVLGMSAVVNMIVVCALTIPTAGWSAVAAAAGPEQFTATWRFSGMAVAYNAAVVIFGGFSPIIVTWLYTQTGWKYVSAAYVTVIVVIASIPLLKFMKDRAGKPLLEYAEDVAE